MLTPALAQEWAVWSKTDLKLFFSQSRIFYNDTLMLHTQHTLLSDSCESCVVFTLTGFNY